MVSALQPTSALTDFSSYKILFSFTQASTDNRLSTCSGIDTKALAFLSVITPELGLCLAPFHYRPLGGSAWRCQDPSLLLFLIWGEFSGYAFSALWKWFWKAREHNCVQSFLCEYSHCIFLFVTMYEMYISEKMTHLAQCNWLYSPVWKNHLWCNDC